MNVKKKKVPAQSSVRWDNDSQKMMAEWFLKNPGWNISLLANQAIKKFVTEVYSTEPIDLVGISEDESESLIEKVMHEHADALERLR